MTTSRRAKRNAAKGIPAPDPTPPSKPAPTDIRSRLFQPVDIASLVFFRIAFGAIMLWEVVQYFGYGWITRDYVEPAFHFTYYGFDWVRPWPGDGLYVHFAILGVLALGIALGLFYRVTTVLYFLGFTYVFLLDATRYQNHLYLICLISFLMIFVPAHRAFSLDALRSPQIRSATVPAWSVWLLRAQIGIVYFYGGLAKLNADWLRGDTMGIFLSRNTDFPLIGQYFTSPSVALVLAYCGMLFDLLVVPLLLWRRTRPFAFAAAVAFHVLNSNWFVIGIFPWFMIAATTLFFEPDWPRRLARAIGASGRPAPGTRARPAGPPPHWRIPALLWGIYFAVQLLVPFRHFLYPGDVNWTEEGHRFSWRMMLVNKRVQFTYVATDPATGRSWEVRPSEYLTPLQLGRVARRPDLILQLSHFIADDLRRKGHPQVEVRAKVVAALQLGQPQWMIDPNVDLAAQPRGLGPAPWIVPLGTMVVDHTRRMKVERAQTPDSAVADDEGGTAH